MPLRGSWGTGSCAPIPDLPALAQGMKRFDLRPSDKVSNCACPKSGKFGSTLRLYAPKPQAVDKTQNLNLLAIKVGEVTGPPPRQQKVGPRILVLDVTVE